MFTYNDVPANVVDGFSNGSYPAANGLIQSYRVHVPACETGRRYPLILHLHGVGSWGADNTAQLRQARRLVRQNEPAFILAPKTLQPMQWVDLDWSATGHVQPADPGPSLQAAYELLLAVIRSHAAIDPDRVYANGQSMGGYGVWDLITRHPDVFAAAVPVCGGGDASRMCRLRHLPIWVFHGAQDTVVPVKNSRILVEALRQAGNSGVRYTEYPEIGHDAWTPAYEDDALFRWLFAQRRASI